jgi:hypothetical protein
MLRFVSRHELFPIRAPLMYLEHCIGPFLNSCDKDDDHRITLIEWGKCLELDEVRNFILNGVKIFKTFIRFQSELADRCEILSNEDE